MEARPTDIDASVAFGKAQEFRMPFGKYRGSSLDKIAETDDGLVYLDGVLAIKCLHESTRLHVTNYLAWPSIASELDAILNEGQSS